MKPPEFLYHYTSVESLAMILSTKKIKFNALNQVDDLDEGKNHDYEHIGKYFFVSCWTKLEEESLPFWNMYTPGMKGVRIKMPSDLFNNFNVSTKEIPGLMQGEYQSIVPQHEVLTSNYWVFPSNGKFLHEITYTDDQEKLLPRIRTVSDVSEETGNRTVSINLGRVGVCKAKHWEFQSEWRYILRIFPYLRKSFVSNTDNRQEVESSVETALGAIKQGEPLPFSCFFVNLNQNKFEQMEILLGPKHTESEKIIVESLIQKFNPRAKLSISGLHKKVR